MIKNITIIVFIAITFNFTLFSKELEKNSFIIKNIKTKSFDIQTKKKEQKEFCLLKNKVVCLEKYENKNLKDQK